MLVMQLQKIRDIEHGGFLWIERMLREREAGESGGVDTVAGGFELKLQMVCRWSCDDVHGLEVLSLGDCRRKLAVFE
ncbi:hypothetical protein MKW98_009199 [Papaver atlanticum]|uniref:Uncharacterized protein n=1 Tax=Papaver atlanticum TaxID=357466 RepID=A0AAD4T7N7_9MAGN|nr:hypothetical protein MKW98_009199 [Papaver atlanticum]